MLLTTVVIYAVMAVAIGVALAVGIKTLQRFKKASPLGLGASSSLGSDELSIVTRLMAQEKQEAIEAAALTTLKRIIDKAAASKKTAV